MDRRTLITMMAAAPLAAAAKESSNMFQQILEASQNEKKGINLYVKGQAIPGIVVKVGADTVELRSREYSRIVVKIEAIDAAAMS